MPSVSPPTNVTATATTGKITVSWTPTSPGSFNVYQGTSSGGETLYQSGVTTSSFDDTVVSSGTTYYYKVTTVLNNQESIKSNEAHATAL